MIYFKMIYFKILIDVNHKSSKLYDDKNNRSRTENKGNLRIK